MTETAQQQERVNESLSELIQEIRLHPSVDMSLELRRQGPRQRQEGSREERNSAGGNNIQDANLIPGCDHAETVSLSPPATARKHKGLQQAEVEHAEGSPTLHRQGADLTAGSRKETRDHEQLEENNDGEADGTGR